MAKAVKLADIALKAGVSTVTVSKALSGQKGVSEELRTKIKALADEMGYTPVHSPQEKKPKSYTIGVLTYDFWSRRAILISMIPFICRCTRRLPRKQWTWVALP